MLVRTLAFWSSAVTAAPFPTFVSDSSNFAEASVDPQNWTHAMTWTSGKRVIVFWGAGGSTTTTLAGTTDDTATTLADLNANAASLYVHEVTVAGGALDATLSYNQNQARRCCAIGLIVTGATTILTPSENGGTAGPAVSTGVTVSGTKKRLVLVAVCIRGTHVTNPPVAPSGYTLVLSVANQNNNPTSTVGNTLALAYQEIEGSTNIANATWQGLADLSTNPWQATMVVMEP